MHDLEQLSRHLRNDPEDLEAWRALLELVDDPEKKKDCQARIDRLLAKREKPVLCPQCGAGMELYFAEPLHDKRAKCAYCGAEIDIPDSYSSLKIKKQTGGYGKTFPETEISFYERRVDGGNQAAGITSDELEKIIAEKGLAAAMQELQARGIRGLKIDQLSSVEGISAMGKELKEQGPDVLKSKEIIFVGSKKINQIIIGIQLFIAAVFVLMMLVGGLKNIAQLMLLFQRLFK